MGVWYHELKLLKFYTNLFIFVTLLHLSDIGFLYKINSCLYIMMSCNHFIWYNFMCSWFIKWPYVCCLIGYSVSFHVIDMLFNADEQNLQSSADYRHIYDSKNYIQLEYIYMLWFKYCFLLSATISCFGYTRVQQALRVSMWST